MYLVLEKDVNNGMNLYYLWPDFWILFSGVKIVYLPAHSPDLNPIEEAFSFVKGYIWRHGERFREAVASKEYDLPFIFLYEALDQITPEMAQGWMRHAGYI